MVTSIIKLDNDFQLTYFKYHLNLILDFPNHLRIHDPMICIDIKLNDSIRQVPLFCLGKIGKILDDKIRTWFGRTTEGHFNPRSEYEYLL